MRHPRFEEKIICRTFDSGLTACLIPKPRFVKSFALLAARYGSIDMDFFDSIEGKRLVIPAGVAHFLEHQLFETARGNATEFFAQLGADVNASLR